MIKQGRSRYLRFEGVPVDLEACSPVLAVVRDTFTAHWRESVMVQQFLIEYSNNLLCIFYFFLFLKHNAKAEVITRIEKLQIQKALHLHTELFMNMSGTEYLFIRYPYDIDISNIFYTSAVTCCWVNFTFIITQTGVTVDQENIHDNYFWEEMRRVRREKVSEN